MKQLLEHLFANGRLTRAEAKDSLARIAEGNFSIEQVSAFLTVFRMRSLDLEELTGFRDCLQERCLNIDLSDFNAMDLCGTGGDGKDTFNISTLASFATAGAGVKVAKHGNYGVSSACGSSNVMEYLGYEFSNDPDRLKRQLDKSGICFLHAPLFHPAMKEVAPIRKNLGVRTFFNMLGPLVNPSFPKKQLVGVSSIRLLRYYKHLFEQSSGSYRLVHALDGYDEVSLTSDSSIVSPNGDQTLSPQVFTDISVSPQSLYGGTSVKDAAAIFIEILEGRGTPEQQAVVTANAALAIQVNQPQKSLEETKQMAIDSLLGGHAYGVFKTLISS